MYQYYSVLLLLIAIPTVISEGACKNPDNWQDANICYKIFKELSSALVNDEGNLYRMQQAFFYAPNAGPALIKVKYNISYRDNITEANVQYCGNVDNTSAIVINETEIIRGWTSRGVYYIINPLTLSRMQMVLPFAILRLINKKWRSLFGSPEVDTFLWDGTYELPTLLIDLHIISLPCIPSEEVFNYTLDEVNAHLKTYIIKYQDLLQSGSRSTAIQCHADDIAYTLSENQLLHPRQDLLLQFHPQKDQIDASYYTFSLIWTYCAFGYFFILIWMLYMKVSKNMKLLRSISSTILDHVDFVISAVFVGYLFIIFEFIATAVYFRSQGLYYFMFHMYLWFPSLLCFLIILFKVMKICCYKKCNWEKSDGLKLLISIFNMGMPLFLLHIYCYTLPTFLLLLVYPTKVITVVAYLTTLIFVTSIVSSITLRLIIVHIKKYRTSTVIDNRQTSIMVIAGAISFTIDIFLMFGVVIQFLYVLVLGEASAISTGPYTVLSLIPTAAISAAGWLVKNKVFSSIDEKEDKEEPNQENDESVTNDGEARALTLVVNEDTPFNGNNQEVRSYGTADNNN